MSIFSRLLGSKKAIDDITDKDNGLLVKAGQWIGNLNLTEQEKKEYDLLVKQWGLKQLDALHPFKIVQRIIVFSVMGLWVFIAINLILAMWVNQFFEAAPLVANLKELFMSDAIFWPVTSVLGLYITGGVIPTKSK